MDALPITEENDVPYRSQNAGVMHACGHDGHTTVLLGAAQVLAARREEIVGQVRFLFQPAEEDGQGALRDVRGRGDGRAWTPPPPSTPGRHCPSGRSASVRAR